MAKSKKSEAHSSGNQSVDQAVGTALKDVRQSNGLTIRDLAEGAGVSMAMISRIENGQVSPSLATLESLSEAAGVPLVNLFRNTIRSADITHVENGNGLKSTRHASEEVHDFTLLGYHKRQDIQFEPYLITLTRDQGRYPRPLLHSAGCEFIYVLEGEMIYQYKDNRYHLRKNDSLSFDAINGHSVEQVISESVRFLNICSQKV